MPAIVPLELIDLSLNSCFIMQLFRLIFIHASLCSCFAWFLFIISAPVNYVTYRFQIILHPLSSFQAIKESFREHFLTFRRRQSWRRKITISASLKPVWNPSSKTRTSGLKIHSSRVNSPNLRMKITSYFLSEISMKTIASNSNKSTNEKRFDEKKSSHSKILRERDF